MDMLAFVAKTIGTTARVGAVVVLAALLIAILRGMNVEPLASIDKSVYGAIVAVGIFGACAVVIEFTIVTWGVVKKVILEVGLPLWENRRTALKNLQTPRADFVATLRYLKANDLQRFSGPAPWLNITLREMTQSCLIEIDDPNYHHGASDTYYSVPKYIKCPAASWPWRCWFYCWSFHAPKRIGFASIAMPWIRR